MRTARRIGAALAIGFAMVAGAGAEARPLAELDEPGPPFCPRDAACGRLMRALDPTGAVPGKVGIDWRLYRHTGTSKAGVIVAQEGGPGYPTLGSAFEYLTLFAPLRPQYDILMINARGTGASAIDCPALHAKAVRTVGDFAACGARLGAASVFYGTRLAVEDMKAVLDKLGIAKINLYGDSYGTFFSQVFAAMYPGMLRSVVLDGAYPVIGQSPWYPENAGVVKNGFNAACARDRYCASLPGTSLARIGALIEALRKQPLRGRAPDGEGAPRNVTIDPATIGFMLFSGSGPVVYRDLDAAARAFRDGDGLPLLRLAAEALGDEDPSQPGDFSYGLFGAVSCMDYQQIYDMNAPVGVRRAERARAIAAQRTKDPHFFGPLTYDEFLRVPLGTSVIDLCLEWPVAKPPYPPGRPIPAGAHVTPAPTLVINGEFDTLTAPAGGAIVASQFANARHIVMANSFHVDAVNDADGCASAIVRRFIVTLDPGDTSCAARVKPVRLVPFFPLRARDAIPARPTAGNAAGTADLALASAAVQTAGDAIARWYVNAAGSGAGLRGGTWRYTGDGLIPHFTFKNVRWVRDLAVSGRAVWNGETGRVQAVLTYTNGKGETARLDARWNDRERAAMARLSGTIGKHAIHAIMPAP